MCCSVLQCLAVRYTYVAVGTLLSCVSMQLFSTPVAVCCSVLQCVAVLSRVSIHLDSTPVAVCCSVLQCVAVCCSDV